MSSSLLVISSTHLVPDQENKNATALVKPLVVNIKRIYSIGCLSKQIFC